MIALALLLSGCGAKDGAGDSDAQVAEVVFAPSFGVWTARLGQTWEGDCALEDDATYLPAEQTWRIEEDRYGFAVRDEVGYRYVCTLTEQDFTCDLPDIEDDFSSIGYDVYATYRYSYVGSFGGQNQLSGVYRLDAACEGDDCDLLTGYGQDFQFPCTAEASLEAELAE